MIYLCIPVHNEEPTIGPLLWKLRKTLTDAEFRRDFRIVVLDDASSDGTGEALDRYRRTLPLTVLRSDQRLGYGRAVDRLLRHVVGECTYPKRDAAIVLQADFSEDPSAVADLVRAIEGGADIVAGHEVTAEGDAVPSNVRWARRAVPWVLGSIYRKAPVSDPLCGFRAYRVIVLKKALREFEDGAISAAAEPWLANLEMLSHIAPHARRIDEVEVRVRRDERVRSSRFEAIPTLKMLWKRRRAIAWPAAATTVASLILASTLVFGGALQGQTGLIFAAAQDTTDTITDNIPGQSVPLELRLVDEVQQFAPPAVPFSVGEHLRYGVKLGIFNVGEGDMVVHGVDTIRGVPSYHVSMGLNASALFGAAKVRDRFESWLDVRTLASRRFIRDVHELNYKSLRVFEIYPEELRWERTDESDDKTGVLLSDQAMDEIAFIYWLRTQELEVGETYTWNDKYFKEEGNPVTVTVLRRDKRTVDAGTFETIVVQPIIQTSGLFSEGGNAEIHFTDDERRLVVYLRSEVPLVGSITLHLESIEGVPERVAGAR